MGEHRALLHIPGCADSTHTTGHSPGMLPRDRGGKGQQKEPVSGGAAGLTPARLSAYPWSLVSQALKHTDTTGWIMREHPNSPVANSNKATALCATQRATGSWKKSVMSHTASHLSRLEDGKGLGILIVMGTVHPGGRQLCCGDITGWPSVQKLEEMLTLPSD